MQKAGSAVMELQSAGKLTGAYLDMETKWPLGHPQIYIVSYFKVKLLVTFAFQNPIQHNCNKAVPCQRENRLSLDSF